MHPEIHLKGFVTSLIIGGVMIVIVPFFFASLDFASTLEPKAYAQESNNNNSTQVLDDIRSIMRDQQRDMSSINNMTSAQAGRLSELGSTTTKLATQGAYTALSVFFLGIGLVIFGLRMTTRASPKTGKYFNSMIWALTLPVLFLVGFFQFRAISGNSLAIFKTEEPFFLLSFLLYVPIGIILVLLLAQKRIVHAQAVNITPQDKKDPIQEMEKLFMLKEKGVITEEEFQKLKTELLQTRKDG